MRTPRWSIAALACALGSPLPIACSSAPTGFADTGGAAAYDGSQSGAGGGLGGGGVGSTASGAQDPGCEGPLGPPRDPATLTSCCDGAHCVPSVPPELEAFVATCPEGGYCVPDEFIATGGVFTPASCSSINGPGVCLSTCIPEVKKVEALLQQDICKATERCVPCVSPLDNKETGACLLSYSCDDAGTAGGTSGGATSSGSGGGDDPSTCEHEGPPVIDPAAFPACPSCGGGHCVDKALVPAEDAALLEACDASTLCVPDEFIKSGGDFVAPTCESVGGFEGRCLSKCLPSVAEQAALLPQSTCPSTHACVPCYDPFDGTATGACELSCDTGPKEPPQSFEKCCGGIGTCLPKSLVPPENLEQLGEDTCPQDNGPMACAPDALIDGTPSGPDDLTNQPCETSFYVWFFLGDEFKDGVCLPRCIPEVDAAPVGDGSCDSDLFKCVPCLDPQTGAPSGACE